jgi:protein-tyrosine phosphatase
VDGERENPKPVYPFRGLSNFRDVGGLSTRDGRTVRTGVLFRSDELSRLTTADVQTLQGFGIRLICDLRSADESRKRGPRLGGASIRTVNVPLHDQRMQDGLRRKVIGFLVGATGGDRFWKFGRSYYHHIAFERPERIREVITLLANDENQPAVLHCSAGRDRTGFVAALIQLLVGVPYEAVRADYLRTNDYFASRIAKFIRVLRVATLGQVSEQRMRLVLMVHPELLDEVHAEIVRRHGDARTYLHEACGVDHDTLRKLEDRLLSGAVMRESSR